MDEHDFARRLDELAETARADLDRQPTWRLYRAAALLETWGRTSANPALQRAAARTERLADERLTAS